MVKTVFILLILFFVHAVCAQQREFKSLRAFGYWKDDSVLCGNNLLADSMGYLLCTRGCEGKDFVFLNHYVYKNDTLILEPFDYLLEDFFIDIKKVLGNGKIQKVTFLGAAGDTIKYSYDTANMVKLLGRLKTKWVEFKEGLQIPRGRYKAIEICQLSRLFGVPAVFWLEKEFDYTIQMNVPSDIFRVIIMAPGILTYKYLVMLKDKVYFPEDKDGYKFKIEEINGEWVNH